MTFGVSQRTDAFHFQPPYGRYLLIGREHLNPRAVCVALHASCWAFAAVGALFGTVSILMSNDNSKQASFGRAIVIASVASPQTSPLSRELSS